MTTYITLGTQRGLGMQQNAVTPSTGTSFPTGFGTNAASSATDEIMVVVNTTALSSRDSIINALYRIIQSIIEDPVVNKYFTK